jgi:CBS domain containing-hemolysin-like protein
MDWLWVIVGVLVALGSVLAMAETSVSRMTRVQALTLRDAGRRNAEVLDRIEENPAPYLNAVYLCVMFVQNGSAIFVAVLADQTFDELWVTVLSFAFTLAYFVVVEAMSKTFGILHSASVALALAPGAQGADPVADRPGERPAPRQGAEGGPLRNPRGDPLHGRGRP